MKEFLNEYTVANSIKQARELLSSTFLIVEGDTDSRFYRNFFGENDCQTQVAHNKNNAVKALEILQKESYQGVLAIVDTDFDILEGKNDENPDLFFTDFHDCECVIFSSPALEKVLSEFGSNEKIQSLGNDVRKMLFEIGAFIGYLRWISLRDELHLTFEEIDFGKFVKKVDLAFDVTLLVNTVKNKSQRPDLENTILVEKINELAINNHDKSQVSCGKDLIEILSIGFQKVLGTNNSNTVASEILARDLRLAYEFEFFISTDLYKSIKGWEKQNIPFRVFR